MKMSEAHRILHSVIRRWTNPRANPLTIRQMAWSYIQRQIYLHYHRLPAIQIPFAFTDKNPPEPQIAVIVHCYYVDLMEEILVHIQQIPFAYQLYVSTDTEEKRSELIRLINAHQIRSFDIRLVPNRGRDIAPKYISFRDAYDHCDFFLHLHSKKSPHNGGTWGEAWRRHLLQTLVGSPDIIRSNIRLLADKRLGLVFPAPVNDTIPALRWGANFNISSELARRLEIEIEPGFCLDCPEGSMYWGKVEAIQPLLDLRLQLEDFPVEKGQLDGGLQHAIERMIIYCALRQGLRGLRVSAAKAYPLLQHVHDERTLSAGISACLEAQDQERLRCDRLFLKLPLRSAP